MPVANPCQVHCNAAPVAAQGEQSGTYLYVSLHQTSTGWCKGWLLNCTDLHCAELSCVHDARLHSTHTPNIGLGSHLIRSVSPDLVPARCHRYTLSHFSLPKAAVFQLGVHASQGSHGSQRWVQLPREKLKTGFDAAPWITLRATCADFGAERRIRCSPATYIAAR